MRWSQSFLVTLREVPGDAEVVSHQLLYRAGMIQKLASGIYSFTPFGFRALRKMIDIVREEMDATGAMEVDLPILQPKELWVESGRWGRYVDDGILFHLEDRKGGEFALAPTAEEAVTDMVRRSVTSWRQLPFNLYQIRTKFRDEIRPRFGLLRGREFLMKDAYSFDVDEKGLDLHYKKMDAAYRRIFERCGLEYALVDADSGAIGGSASQEFMVVAETGEDALVFSDAGDYGANLEKAVTGPLPEPWAGEEEKPLQKASAPTPDLTTCVDQAKHLGTTPSRIVKTMIYEAFGADGKTKLAAVLIRGDLDINEVKLPKALAALHAKLVSEEILRNVSGTVPGFVGPLGLQPFEENPIAIYVDRSLQHGRNVWCGANSEGLHRARRHGPPLVQRRCRSCDGTRRRPIADGKGRHASHQARHRGRPHLQARDEVLRGDEVRGRRPEPKVGPVRDGVLRTRPRPHGGSRHRAEPRRRRDRLARAARALRVCSGRPAARRARPRGGGQALREPQGCRRRGFLRRSRRASRRQVQGPRPHRLPRARRRGRQGPREGRGGGLDAPREEGCRDRTGARHRARQEDARGGRQDAGDGLSPRCLSPRIASPRPSRSSRTRLC